MREISAMLPQWLRRSVSLLCVFPLLLGASLISFKCIGILAKGFEAIGWSAEVASNPTKLPSTTSPSPLLLVQLHGAPHAKEDDKVLLDLLASVFKASTGHLRLAVLIHRPDELPLVHPAFRAAFDASLSAAPPVSFRLVFMGDMHINDACYQIGANVTVPDCNMQLCFCSLCCTCPFFFFSFSVQSSYFASHSVCFLCLL